MHRLAIALVVLFCATSAAHAFRGECVLQVKGVSYIKGPCDITTEKSGDFEVSTLKGQRLYFAQVSHEDDGTTNGFWNGTVPGADHAHAHLGILTQQGGCWVNDQAKICAWRPGTQKPLL